MNTIARYGGKIGCAFIALVVTAELACIQMVHAEREVIRGAAGGALGGAAVGKLSDGDAGKGAAWGAGIGAAKGIAKKRRAEQETAAAEDKARQDARIRELELQQAYDQGRRDGSRVDNRQTK